MENEIIQSVDVETLNKIINTRKPFGLFIAHDNDRFVAVDNTTGDAWTEDFVDRETAVSWLYREFEVS